MHRMEKLIQKVNRYTYNNFVLYVKPTLYVVLLIGVNVVMDFVGFPGRIIIASYTYIHK